MQLRKEGSNEEKEGGNEEKEGSNEAKKGSRPPGSKNETLNPIQKTKAQEMHYVSWCAGLRPSGSHSLCFLWVRGLLTAFVFLAGKVDEAGRAVVAPQYNSP